MFQFILQPSLEETASQVGGGLVIFEVAVGVTILVALIIGLAILIRRLRRPELEGLTREKVAELWAQIEHSSDQGIMGAKVALMEADKLLDNVLRSMMIPGETLGERLKSAAYKYPNIRNVWPAHRLRNQLVHDSSVQLSVGQAKGALRDFKAALKTLNIL